MTHILYVEDNPIWIGRFISCLNNLGYRIVHHVNLKKAQDDYDLRFDIVICAASLQCIDDGLDWVQKLHESGIKALVFFKYRTSVEVPFLNEDDLSEDKLKSIIEKLLEGKNAVPA